MIKVGIVGGTGYTGVELIRLLANHPEVVIASVTSRAEAGLQVCDLFPHLRGHVDLVFSSPEDAHLSTCDLVYFATPNGVSMHQVPQLLDAGVRIIDLAADFRLRAEADWEQWYDLDHVCPDLLDEAVYGLPELYRDKIKNAQLIANPGCYPTAVTLGFLPLIENNIVQVSGLIADAKSGVSGAGRGAAVEALLCETSESLKAYGVNGHRHLPEITQNLQSITNQPVSLTFIPHLTPMIRGIHATLYATLNTDELELQTIYEQRFQQEPFVDVLPIGSTPQTSSVRASNYCRIAVHRPQHSDTVVVLSVIDNLVKGAAGQAIQNMNIMFGFDETLGLESIAVSP